MTVMHGELKNWTHDFYVIIDKTLSILHELNT